MENSLPQCKSERERHSIENIFFKINIEFLVMINGSVLLCWKSSDFAAPLLRTGSVQQFVAGVLLPVYWRMMCERYPWKVESKSKETVRVSNSEMVKKSWRKTKESGRNWTVARCTTLLAKSLDRSFKSARILGILIWDLPINTDVALIRGQDALNGQL